MATMNITRTGNGTDWFRTAQGLLVPPVDGIDAIGPTTMTGCTVCNSTVRARPQFNGPTGVRYVLPVDEHGRCPDCQWMERYR